jgi:hypothetical protein
MAMDAVRFEHLASAYGGDLRRWPVADREGATVFAAENRALSERLLFEARQIDAVLETVTSAAPSMALRDRVLAGAPKSRPRERRRAGWFWLPSAGFAAACAAGAILGVIVIERVSASSNADTVLAANAEPGWSDADSTETM